MTQLRASFIVGVIVLLTLLPLLALAKGLVPCGGVGEPACQSCHVIDLTNNVVGWLVFILGTVAAIIIVFAGTKLVTGSGNTQAMQEAKSLINSMIIGYVIVLAGWLLIDTGLKALLNEGTYGVWNQVQCVEQPKLDSNEYVPTPVEITRGFNTSNRCDAAPNGAFVICTEQARMCGLQGGYPTTITTNPREYSVRCDFPPQAYIPLPPSLPFPPPQPSVPGAGGCTVQTNPANACHPSRLTCFGGTNLASRICSQESYGGRTDARSSTDICRDGNSFSMGLWQINLIVHYAKIPGCSQHFRTYGEGLQGSCVRSASGGRYCAVRNCEVTNVSMYNYCSQQVMRPEINTQIACGLYSARGNWGDWSYSAGLCGG